MSSLTITQIGSIRWSLLPLLTVVLFAKHGAALFAEKPHSHPHEWSPVNNPPFKLNHSCFGPPDCGFGAICWNDRCQCRINHEPHLDRVHCHKKICSDNRGCSPNENLECNREKSECSCVHPYQFDSRGVKCVRGHDPMCLYDDTCSSNEVCYRNHCQCQMGYARFKNGDPCRKIDCTRDQDCHSWNNANCNFFNECTCNVGYQLSKNGYTCFKVVHNYHFLAQNIFTIVIVCNFLLWLTIFIFVLHYIKRRRLAASSIANSRNPAGVRNLPPGMPPPPPAYDNAAYPGFAPPPYSPSDPNKSPASNQLSEIEVPSTLLSIISVPPEPQPQTVPSNPS